MGAVARGFKSNAACQSLRAGAGRRWPTGAPACSLRGWSRAIHPARTLQGRRRMCRRQLADSPTTAVTPVCMEGARRGGAAQIPGRKRRRVLSPTTWCAARTGGGARREEAPEGDPLTPDSPRAQPILQTLLRSISSVLCRRIADNDEHAQGQITHPLFCEDTHTEEPLPDIFEVVLPPLAAQTLSFPTLYTLKKLPPPSRPPPCYPVPSHSTVLEFIENIWHRARLTPQALVVCLVYVDRLEARCRPGTKHCRAAHLASSHPPPHPPPHPTHRAASRVSAACAFRPGRRARCCTLGRGGPSCSHRCYSPPRRGPSQPTLARTITAHTRQTRRVCSSRTPVPPLPLLPRARRRRHPPSALTRRHPAAIPPPLHRPSAHRCGTTSPIGTPTSRPSAQCSPRATSTRWSVRTCSCSSTTPSSPPRSTRLGAPERHTPPTVGARAAVGPPSSAPTRHRSARGGARRDRSSPAPTSTHLPAHSHTRPPPLAPGTPRTTSPSAPLRADCPNPKRRRKPAATRPPRQSRAAAPTSALSTS